MPYPIDRKLVVAVSSNALFNLDREHQLFKEKGIEAYKAIQLEKKDEILPTGRAFPFIKRFLNINKVYTDEQPVEVVLLSNNSPETGMRIFNSIKAHGLDITRAAFTSGESRHKFIPAFNVSLFLSTNRDSVTRAIHSNHAAGVVMGAEIEDDPEDFELRIAFDFDGVIADDESEKVYKKNMNLDEFHEYETLHAKEPMNPGLLADFFRKLSYFQKLESKKMAEDSSYKKILKTAIITARSAPAHERALTTLNSWEVAVDELFLMGGIEKRRVLEVVKPHLFIDDQMSHLDPSLTNIPLVHLPFGIANEKME